MAYRMASDPGYPIIDADTHVTEPPDLWQKHLPKKFREAGPRVVDSKHGGQAWAIANGTTMAVTRLVNTAGVAPTDWDLIPKDGYASMRSGGWDPVDRIADMDIDMIDVHLVFPSYAFRVCDADDHALYLANIRAYNDWLAEFCAHEPTRLYGFGIMPHSGVDDAIAEATRVREKHDMRSVVLRTWPNGSLIAKHAVDDKFWSAAEDLDLGVACHVGFNITGQGKKEGLDDPEVLMAMATLPFINQEKLAVDAMPVISEMILGGALERHPRLRLGLIEVGIAWVPFFLEQSNDNYMRHRFWTKAHLPMPPSEYWARQCYASFQVDTYGLANRHRVGIDTIMWTSDYPHAGSDWPNARERIGTQLAGFPEEEKRKILSANAARWFGIEDEIAALTAKYATASA
jgi:predicted TIM-barrel fold metal-dependent hydrolase